MFNDDSSETGKTKSVLPCALGSQVDVTLEWNNDMVSKFLKLRAGHPQKALEWFVSTMQKQKDDSRKENPEDLLKECLLVDGIDPKFKIYPYQAFAMRFILYREVHPHGSIPGGILNMFPGLGKTLCLLTIVWGTWTSDRIKRRPTLVVVPKSVVYEWRSNILKFFGDRLPFMIMHREWNEDKKAVENVTVQQLMQYPLVITTYPTLRTVFAPRKDRVLEDECICKSDSGKMMGIRRAKTSDPRTCTVKGAECLFRVPWARVAFDESQTACNVSSLTFKACYAVPAPLRWCLTGMPLRNSTNDLFGQLLMAGMKTPLKKGMMREGVFFDVRKTQWDDNSFHNQRLDLAMLTVVYKDTHLRMPPLRTEYHAVQMHPEEQQIYELYTNEARKEFIRYDLGHALVKNVLESITRLRQASDCIYLLHLSDLKKRIARKEKVDGDLDLSDDDEKKEQKKEECRIENKQNSAYQQPIDLDSDGAFILLEPKNESLRSMGTKNPITRRKKQTKLVLVDSDEHKNDEDEDDDDDVQIIENPVSFVTSRKKERKLITLAKQSDSTAPSTLLRSKIGGTLTATTPSRVKVNEEEDNEQHEEKETNEEDLTLDDILNEQDDIFSVDTPSNVLDPVKVGLGYDALKWCRTWEGTAGRGGSKIQAILNLLRKIVTGELVGKNENKSKSEKGNEEKELPTVSVHAAKVIVYSSYAEMLRLLSKALGDYPHCIMMGEHTPEERSNTLDTFRMSTTHNILFMTYRVGSLGLTLTEATHVIFTEPWYCYEVHVQAMYRAYRIGQRSPVTVHWMISHTGEDGSNVDRIEKEILRIASRKIKLTNEMLQRDLVSDVPSKILSYMDNAEEAIAIADSGRSGGQPLSNTTGAGSKRKKGVGVLKKSTSVKNINENRKTKETRDGTPNSGDKELTFVEAFRSFLFPNKEKEYS